MIYDLCFFGSFSFRHQWLLAATAASMTLSPSPTAHCTSAPTTWERLRAWSQLFNSWPRRQMVSLVMYRHVWWWWQKICQKSTYGTFEISTVLVNKVFKYRTSSTCVVRINTSLYCRRGLYYNYCWSCDLQPIRCSANQKFRIWSGDGALNRVMYT